MTSAYDGSDNYALHARLIGAVPRREEDLFVSVLMSFVFCGLAGWSIWKWREPRKKGDVMFFPFKTDVLLGVAIACLFLGLAFFTRAVIAGNGDPGRFNKQAYAVENIFFLIAALIFVDLPALTMLRDEILWEELEVTNAIPKTRPVGKMQPPHHWVSKYVMAFRALNVFALFLYIAGFAALPSPADAVPSKKSTLLRLAASLIVFFLCLFMYMIIAYVAIQYRLPKEKQLLFSRLFVGFIVSCMFVPQLYNFLIAAVSNDNLSLIESKVFFYFAYAFFPGIIALPCSTIEINLWTASREFPYIIVK